MNLIIAVQTPKIYEELKNDRRVNILFQNIQYKEALLEILDRIKKLDAIIIEEELPGKVSTEEIIKKIKEKNNQIKIILINNHLFYKKTEERKKNIIRIKENKKGKILSILFNEKKSEIKTNKKQNNNKKIVAIFKTNKLGIILLEILFYIFSKKDSIAIVNYNMKYFHPYIHYFDFCEFQKRRKEIEEKNKYIFIYKIEEIPLSYKKQIFNRISFFLYLIKSQEEKENLKRIEEIRAKYNIAKHKIIILCFPYSIFFEKQIIKNIFINYNIIFYSLNKRYFGLKNKYEIGKILTVFERVKIKKLIFQLMNKKVKKEFLWKLQWKQKKN